MEKILGKSDGTTLIKHSKLVSKFATIIAKQNSKNISDNDLEGIRIGGLLHDVGKIHNNFQKKLKKTVLDETELDNNLPFRHNEVGWAFLRNYLNLKQDILDIVLDVTYWHHGISNIMGKYNDTDILSKLLESDIEKMITFTKNILGDEFTHLIEEKPYRPKSSPQYYLGDNNDNYDDNLYINSKNTFNRACIITADRLVSSLGNSLTDDFDIETYLLGLNKRDTNLNFELHPYYGNERFNSQVKILDDIERTTIIKAPAGFGKTLLALLWSFNKDKKIIWVCPRNVVADSVYHSIIEEIESLNSNVSVELYLSGEVVKHNEFFTKDFGSDIIVTNVDNYLAPSINNSVANRLLSIINYNVVFDEYHELIGDGPIHAAFVNLMNVRANITTSETLLLSASPTTLHSQWDSLSNKTKVLPSDDSHYPAPHQSKYKINVSNEFPKNIESDGNLFIFNSIKNAQRNMKQLNSDKIFHSNFIDKDKEDLLNYIYDTYGKKSERNIRKDNLVGTHVMQASLDISFKNIFESVLSPESTVQRIGRCNRWGDYSTQSTINIINYHNSSEKHVRDLLYTNNLSNIWFEYLTIFDGLEITLDEIYNAYNNFNKTYSKVLSKHLIDKHDSSLKALSKIYPVKYFKGKKSKIRTAGSNKLRSSSNELFFICKNYDSIRFCDPFSVSLYQNHAEDFNEEGDMLSKLKKSMKEIRDQNDKRFDYNELIKKGKYITLDSIRAYSRKSDTPYIRYDVIYHPNYGLISENMLNELI